MKDRTMKRSGWRSPARMRGFSLVELAIALGVAMLILAGVGAWAMSTMDRNDTRELVQAISAVDHTVLQQYANLNDYSSVTTRGVVESLPSSIRATRCPSGSSPVLCRPRVLTPWNGAITVAVDARAVTRYAITVNGPVPVEACRDALMSLGAKFWAVSVGTNIAKASGRDAITRATAVTACDAASDTLRVITLVNL